MTPELFVKDFFEAFHGKRLTEARCKQFLLIRLRYFEQEIKNETRLQQQKMQRVQESEAKSILPTCEV